MVAGAVEACGRLLPFFQKVFKSIQDGAIGDLGVAEVRRDRMQVRDGALHGSAGLSGREELIAEVLVLHFVDEVADPVLGREAELGSELIDEALETPEGLFSSIRRPKKEFCLCPQASERTLQI